MTLSLAGVRVGFIERRHPPGRRGSLVESLVPLLRDLGAAVDLVHAEDERARLDVDPGWDVAVLKSGSAAAHHRAAAAEARGVPCLNGADATRLAQDKLASTAMLQRAGLPIAPARLVWLGNGLYPDGLARPGDRRLVVKAARGSQGVGLWIVVPGELPARLAALPPGPYLAMDWVEHRGDDLKIFVAGDWLAAIERPFPAQTLAEKRGRPVEAPSEVIAAARDAGRLLGLSCFGCDFVASDAGWVMVDVNAFPGYKGADAAPAAIAREIAAAAGRGRSR